VHAFGCNDHGVLGRSTDNDEAAESIPMLAQLGSLVITQVSAGDSHTAALARGGQVWIWGAFRVIL